jgi:hypothetical protein
VGNNYDEMSNILGSQLEAPRQKVRLTIAGNQTANQPGAPTPTTVLLGSCLGIITATGKAVLLNSANVDGSDILAAYKLRLRVRIAFYNKTGLTGGACLATEVVTFRRELA